MSHRHARGFWGLGLTLVLAAIALHQPGRVHATPAQDQVFAAVADKKGKPVSGLTAADFKVAIDGRAQEILSVAPATGPVSVVIITDRLGLDPAYSTFTVQRVLAGFVKGVRTAHPDSRIALTTFDGPVVRITGFGSPAAELDRAIGRLSTTATEGGMLDALVDACQLFRGSLAERRAIFAVFAAYRGDSSVQRNDRTAMALWESKASLWAIEVQSPGTSGIGNPIREEVVSLGSRMSGGMSDSVASAVGLDSMAKQMAALLTNQYVVTYGPSTDATTSTRRAVSVNGPGLRVLAATWVTPR